MYDDFINPDVAAYFTEMQGTLAMALYQRWKNGETIRVRTVAVEGKQSVEFEIRPERLFESGPVMAATILVDGKPAGRENTGIMMSDSEFLDWCSTLEAVE